MQHPTVSAGEFTLYLLVGWLPLMGAELHDNGKCAVAVIPVHFAAVDRVPVHLAGTDEAVVAHIGNPGHNPLIVRFIGADLIAVAVRCKEHPAMRVSRYDGVRLNLLEKRLNGLYRRGGLFIRVARTWEVSVGVYAIDMTAVRIAVRRDDRDEVNVPGIDEVGNFFVLAVTAKHVADIGHDDAGTPRLVAVDAGGNHHLWFGLRVEFVADTNVVNVGAPGALAVGSDLGEVRGLLVPFL